MIAVEQLTKDYGAVRAVDDLSFTVPRGAVVGFLGPNGPGNSTTLRAPPWARSPNCGHRPHRRAPVRGAGGSAEDGRRRARRGGASGPHGSPPPPGAGGGGRCVTRPRGPALGACRAVPGPPTRGTATTRSGWASASASPAPWSATRACSSSTGPPTASIPRASAGSATSCARWPARAAPSCSPAMS